MLALRSAFCHRGEQKFPVHYENQFARWSAVNGVSPASRSWQDGRRSNILTALALQTFVT